MHARHRFHGRNGKRTLGRHCACRLHAPRRRRAPTPQAQPQAWLPANAVSLSASDPASLGNAEGVVSLAGSAHADATTVETYRNIVITPPGAWDGVSYAYGLPRGIPARWRRTHHHRATTLCDQSFLTQQRDSLQPSATSSTANESLVFPSGCPPSPTFPACARCCLGSEKTNCTPPG